MLSVSEIRDAMQDRRVSVVAKHTGLHRMTIYALLNGLDDDNHKLSTIRKLSDYLNPKAL